MGDVDRGKKVIILTKDLLLEQTERRYREISLQYSPKFYYWDRQKEDTEKKVLQ